MKFTNVFIVDENKNDVIKLEELVKSHSLLFKVIGTCSNSKEALLKIERKNPDVIFIDMDTAQKRNFELLEFLQKKSIILILMVHDNKGAINAYKHNANFILEKPFYKESLAIVFNHIYQKIILQLI